jgi:hypothetical protein
MTGIFGYAIALPGVAIGPMHFDAHTLLFASVFLLCGYQSVLFAIFARTFAVTEGILPPNKNLFRFYEIVNLEKGLTVAGLAMIAGIVLLIMAVSRWHQAGFGELDYAKTMRLVVPGVTLLALGFQTLLSSFLISMLGMKRR